MRNAQDYVTLGTLEEAKAAITMDATDEIREELERMDEYYLVDILKEENDEFHTMDELDDVFSYMGVTEILEELSEIELGDDYFNEDTRRSGNDIWEVADVDIDGLVDRIHDGYTEVADDDILDTLETEQALIDEVTEKFRVYDKAKELFEESMTRNPQEVLSLLWNMNM